MRKVKTIVAESSYTGEVVFTLGLIVDIYAQRWAYRQNALSNAVPDLTAVHVRRCATSSAVSKKNITITI